MARSFKFVFPSPRGTEICALQTLGAAGSAALNGTLSNATQTVASFVLKGYCRSLAITSANNLSAINFTATGTQNGVTVTEVIAGPNNNSVYGTVLFDEITSITTSGAAAAFSIGGGLAGFFNVITVDPYLKPTNYSLMVTGINVGKANEDFNLWGGNQTISQNGSTYLQNIDNGGLIEIITPITGVDFFFPQPTDNPSLFTSLLVEISDHGGDEAMDPIVLAFKQV